MTTREAIQTLEILKIFDAPDLREAVKMAIAALRAQQKPIGRSRWKGCEVCTKAKQIMFAACFEGEKRFAHDGIAEFCPVCGRPLTEEAWAELEQRIGGNDETD